MYVRILLCLVVGTAIIIGCKKDNTPTHFVFRGVVLDKNGNTPVAGAKVRIYFYQTRVWPGSNWANDSAQTNVNGQYEFHIPYNDKITGYQLQAVKDDLQQATSNENHIALGVDTILMEAPTWLQLTVKITRPVTDSISCYYQVNPPYIKWVPLLNYPFPPPVVLKQPGTYTFAPVPYSITLFPEIWATLIKPATPPNYGIEEVAKKQITPVPYDTTLVEIEY